LRFLVVSFNYRGCNLLFFKLTRTILTHLALIVFLLFQALLVLIIGDWLGVKGRFEFSLPLLLFLFFLIGVGGQYVFLRLIGKWTVREEADKFLIDRAKGSRGGGWRRSATRWLVWMPAVAVLIVSLFLPETLALGSHIMHRGAGRLIGYQVSLPIDWLILLHDYEPSHTWSVLIAAKVPGVLRSGLSCYWRKTCPTSHMDFYGTHAGDSTFYLPPDDTIASKRRLPFAHRNITCLEFVPWHVRGADNPPLQSIKCFTPTKEFSATLGGDKSNIGGFYETLQRIKSTE
jgi:hypothetical protein